MASSSRSGAGGKIVTNRRKQRLSATPYDRPTSSVPPPEPEKPTNWFTGFIIPSARAIASGAGKIVSAIISDNESSSEDEEDSLSEDDVNENEYENQYSQDTQLGVRKTDTKHLLEQLILQETFSRDEFDRLVNVLSSRVLDRPIGAGEDRLLGGSPKSDNHGDSDQYNKALLEAKKWFEDKKGSSSRTELVQSSFYTKSTALQLVEDESGSPVDVARSYMKERPPWASPTKNIELGTPSKTAIKLLNEGTGSVGRGSLSLSKKRNSLAAGSWNIQEELRRVRSKATEDMLRTPPSRIDQSLFAAATTQQDSAGASKVISVAGGKTSVPVSFRNNKQIDTLVDTGASYDPAPPAVASRQDGKASEIPSKSADPSNNETFEAAVEMDRFAAPNFSHPSSPTHMEEQHTVQAQVSKPNGSSAAEVTEHGAKENANGLLSSHGSGSADIATAENHEQQDENNIQNGDSKTDKSENPTQAYVEVHIATETTNITSGTLDVQSEEVSADLGQPFEEGKGKKQVGRKPSKVSRRGKGRGK